MPYASPAARQTAMAKLIRTIFCLFNFNKVPIMCCFFIIPHSGSWKGPPFQLIKDRALAAG